MRSPDEEQPREVELRTGARLHFGLLSTGQASVGRLGGIGMMIDRPCFALRATKADADVVTGPPDAAKRVTEFLRLTREGLWREPKWANRHVAIDVVEAIPSHHGFGSGTQLAFATAAILTRWFRPKSFNYYESLGRGRRSEVGLWGFFDGKFNVDAGDSCRGRFGRDGYQEPVPAAWRFVIVDPVTSIGPSGSEESEAFRKLEPMPSETTDALCRLVRDSILPGLRQADFAAFASGVAMFNRLVGEHFAPVQGGVYSHPLIRELVQVLANTAWPYLAQSSWGPAAAVFCESSESADVLFRFLTRRVSPDQATVTIASPLNRGAAASGMSAWTDENAP